MKIVQNYIGGKFVDSAGHLEDVVNPATAEVIAQVPYTTQEEVEGAVGVANKAFLDWRRVPPTERVVYLFKLEHLLGEQKNFDRIARSIVEEEGKTLAEARGEVTRTIENVRDASSVVHQLGYNMEIARGIEDRVVRRPRGVFAMLAPFNFPAMVPWWIVPYGIATGNTQILKPSERAPITQSIIFELVDQLGLPPGVINLVNGDFTVSNYLLESEGIVGASSVGSSKGAEAIYKRGTSYGKKVLALGGAKNFTTVMADANLEKAVNNIIGSCYGCAGERCLSADVVLVAESVYEQFIGMFVEAARKLKLGYGLNEGVDIGPVITAKSRERILGMIGRALGDGATLALDRRFEVVKGYEKGYFIGPIVLEGVRPGMEIAQEEIFGPVACLMKMADGEVGLREAISITNSSRYGNAASIFTESGYYAKIFESEIKPGMVGINIAVVAPVAPFPFGGTAFSLFGDLKTQGWQIVDFFTEHQTIVSRYFGR